jgi:hypothetical protein
MGLLKLWCWTGYRRNWAPALCARHAVSFSVACAVRFSVLPLAALQTVLPCGFHRFSFPGPDLRLLRFQLLERCVLPPRLSHHPLLCGLVAPVGVGFSGLCLQVGPLSDKAKIPELPADPLIARIIKCFDNQVWLLKIGLPFVAVKEWGPSCGA